MTNYSRASRNTSVPLFDTMQIQKNSLFSNHLYSVSYFIIFSIIHWTLTPHSIITFQINCHYITSLNASFNLHSSSSNTALCTGDHILHGSSCHPRSSHLHNFLLYALFENSGASGYSLVYPVH